MKSYFSICILKFSFVSEFCFRVFDNACFLVSVYIIKSYPLVVYMFKSYYMFSLYVERGFIVECICLKVFICLLYMFKGFPVLCICVKVFLCLVCFGFPVCMCVELLM